MSKVSIAVALALAAVVASGCRTRDAAGPGAGRIVDLSHDYDPGTTIYWPTDTRGFELEVLDAGMTERGYYYAANRFATAEHGGTHLDAPIHFAEGRATVEQIPLERLVGPGIVVDVERAASGDPDYQVGVADLRAWEQEHGRIPDGAIVLLRTGHGRHWGERSRYLGTERTGPEAVAELHFPGLDPDAARWIVEQRSIGSIGIDSPSIDHGPSKLFRSHRILFEREVPALENLARLDELPPRGFWVAALPMKIRGGSGAPLRAVAVLPAGPR